tara:strand:+ start:215 stop:484 length:270 start_codon:yes stop_codon:yes gene_type:complete
MEVIMREIEVISYLLNLDPTPNGSNFNWSATTHEGKKISLYYDVNRPKRDHHWVEAYDPSNHLGLNAPLVSDIVGIEIIDLPKHFKRED